MRDKLEFCTITFAWLSVCLLLAVFLSLLSFLLSRGLPEFGISLFFGETPIDAAILGRAAVWDGIWPACVGTLYLIVVSSLIALPIGIASGVFLAQFARGNFKRWLLFCIDLLAGIPSIVVGLFGFTLILFLRNLFYPAANTCLLLSAFCIAFLVLPYLIHTTERSISALPEALKLTGPSLGLSSRQNVLRILLPSASRGILGGVILTIGRAAEDTAVILMTGVVANAGLPGSLWDKYEALPFFIYYTAGEHLNQKELDQGFGAALVLLCLTSLLFISANLLQRTLEKTWR